MYAEHDTIVAIATPPGRGGIGVVRLSGAEALPIARSMIDGSRALEPRHATFARIVDAHARGAAVDQVVVTWFEGPHSYTGEDVVEISGHGSPVLLRQIIELAMARGARLAEPGEFTLRAYLNGRLDLTQAEAVADLVNAVTPLQARAAMDQLEGTLTKAIGAVDAALFDLSARLEASLDFPEEGFHFVGREDVDRELLRLRDLLEHLLSEGRVGRLLREGQHVAIVGPPNAGKSSLFNALVGAPRAIVTAVPGTTRDLVSERVDIRGLSIALVDTAGLRETTDAIEAEGVARARQAQAVASLSVVVIDASAALTDDARDVLRATREPRVIVASKADLPRAWTDDDAGVASESSIAVSAMTGEGVDTLRAAIVRALTAREELRDTPAITNVRHLALVERARDSIVRASGQLRAGATEELVLIDVVAARTALEEITGRRTADDVLHHIFATFCIGK